MEENNGKKRWGRRLGLGIAALIHFDAFYAVAVLKGLDLSWVEKPAIFIFGLVAFIGGYLTATDILKK